MNDSVTSISIELDDLGSVVIEITASLLIEFSLFVLANGAGIGATGHFQQVRTSMFQVILVQQVGTTIHVQQDDLFQGVGGDVTDIVHMHIVQ
jgi:hypothetical protein